MEVHWQNRTMHQQCRLKENTILSSVWGHTKALLERQQYISNKENDKESDYIVRSHRYDLGLDG